MVCYFITIPICFCVYVINISFPLIMSGSFCNTCKCMHLIIILMYLFVVDNNLIYIMLDFGVLIISYSCIPTLVFLKLFLLCYESCTLEGPFIVCSYIRVILAFPLFSLLFRPIHLSYHSVGRRGGACSKQILCIIVRNRYVLLLFP